VIARSFLATALWPSLCHVPIERMLESVYRGYRIEVIAFISEGGWDADVRIRRTSAKALMCAGHLTWRKQTAKIAEESGAVCAREWIDRHG
jgi:hypothetical protein